MRTCVSGAVLALAVISVPSSDAAEGGYSNYIPGTYGDFALAVEPESRLTIRNDVYYYNAEVDRSVRSGLIEAEADLTFVLNMTTLIYKPEIEILGAQYAVGALLPIVYADIDLSRVEQVRGRIPNLENERAFTLEQQ